MDAVARVEAEINRLPPRQREVLHLCAIEGFGHAEAAAVLGTTAEAIKANLAHARKTLRERLATLDPASGSVKVD